jgi:hypothetical protein
MSRWGTVPLDSFELAQYAVQVACYVCDGGNRFDAEFCRHCRAPLALAFNAGRQKSQPLLLAVLGGPHVGKTCHVGMLTDMLSRQPEGLQMLVHGAFSVSLQQQTIAALGRRTFPPSTSSEPEGWHWVHCDVHRPSRKRPLELVIPDVSGAAVADEIESPQRLPSIRRLFTKGAAAMVLLETTDMEGSEQQSEFVAMKIVSEMLSAPAPKRKGWANRPVAIVFTKADRCDSALDNPEEYARRYTAGLWRQCHERLQNHRFFASSIASVHVGVDGYGDRVAVPMRIEPRGVLEPFAWLVEQLA